MNVKPLVAGMVTLTVLLIGFSSQENWWQCFAKESTQAQTELTEIYWEDLIPDDFVQPENPLATMTQEEIDKLLEGSDESNARLEKLQEEFNYAPVVEELDGMRVKLPAYITPLDFDGNTRLKEFLLVPYVGACIHTPPPPANQVVHAQSAETIELDNIYEPVWAIGTIHAETVSSELAESGYRLDVEKIMKYVPEDE